MGPQKQIHQMLNVGDRSSHLCMQHTSSRKEAHTPKAQEGKHRQVQEGSFHDVSSTSSSPERAEEAGEGSVTIYLTSASEACGPREIIRLSM